MDKDTFQDAGQAFQAAMAAARESGRQVRVWSHMEKYWVERDWVDRHSTFDWYIDSLKGVWRRIAVFYPPPEARP